MTSQIYQDELTFVVNSRRPITDEVEQIIVAEITRRLEGMTVTMPDGSIETVFFGSLQ